MKVVLSSDDESDNCDISGAVYDLLNDNVYPIGAGVSGNIEITENGENINVAPYATATVNVSGGGGFPKCTVTVINPNQLSSNRMPFNASIYFKNNIAHYETPILDGNTTEEMMYLYQNEYEIDQDGQGTFIFIGWATENTLITNMINCSILTDGALAELIVVTDPTLDSSFTATMMTDNG